MLRAIMAEAWSVGRALGVPLRDDLVDRQHKLVLAQADDEGTSLRHDLLTGHRMELEALQGTLRPARARDGHPDAVDRRRLRDPRAVGAPERAGRRAGRPMMGPGRFAVEPPRERPDSPPKSYGVPRRGGAFIEWAHVIERCTAAEATGSGP